MGLFDRHRETLNEQLLREAGLAPAEPAGPKPADPGPADPTEVAAGDVHLGWLGRVDSGPLAWDVIVTVKAPALSGGGVAFTTLPDGDIIVEDEQGDADLSPLADALEEKIRRPYHALGTHHENGVWVVGAKRIQVAQVELAEGSTIELTQNGGVRELLVDGKPSNAEVPELERLGEREGAGYCVEAARIDGDSWEVQASAL